MVVEWVETMTWEIAAWSTDHQTVVGLAKMVDRSLWPGDYHIWWVIGLALKTFFAGYGVFALIRGLPVLFKNDIHPRLFRLLRKASQ